MGKHNWVENSWGGAIVCGDCGAESDLTGAESPCSGPTLALPEGYAARKALPLYTFMFEYFPLAWLEVVKVAVAGNKQHANEGSGIRWAREKSTDQMNCAFRHIFDYGTGNEIDDDLQFHLAKAIWRLMAQLQLDLEKQK